MRLTSSQLFEIHQTDPFVIVSFGPEGTPNHCYHPECLADLLELIESTGCQILVFDFERVHRLVSGLLGMFVCLQQRGVEVQIWRPAAHLKTAIVNLQLGDLVLKGDPIGCGDREQSAVTVRENLAAF